MLTRVVDVMNRDVPSVPLDASFKDVIHKMSSGCQGMVIVQDKKGMLVGIITDGDLRRYMEKNDNFYLATAERM